MPDEHANKSVLEAAEWTAKLPPVADPLKALVLAYAVRSFEIDSLGAACVARAPRIAPEAFALRVYPGCPEKWLIELQTRLKKALPDWAAQFLQTVNGCFAFDLSLYGLPPSLFEVPPVLRRDRLQPLALEMANKDWWKSYAGTQSALYFGGRHYSYTENAGYFFSEGVFWSQLKNGKVLGRWDCLDHLLREELPIAESLYLAKNPFEPR